MIHLPAGFSALFKTKWDWGYQTTPQKQLAGRRADWPRMKAPRRMLVDERDDLHPRQPRRLRRVARRVRGRGLGLRRRPAVLRQGRGQHPARRAVPRHRRTAARRGPPLHATSSATRSSTPPSPPGFKPTDDFNGAEQEGAGLYQVTCKKGRRWSVADAYIHPNRNRPNFTVRTDAFVQRIEMDGNRATGVTYRRGGVERDRHRRRRGRPVGRRDRQPADPHAVRHRPRCPPARDGHRRPRRLARRRPEPAGPPGLRRATSTPRTRRDLAEFLTMGNLVKAQKAGRGPLTSNVGEAGGFFRTRDELDVARPAVPHGADVVLQQRPARGRCAVDSRSPRPWCASRAAVTSGCARPTRRGTRRSSPATSTTAPTSTP